MSTRLLFHPPPTDPALQFEKAQEYFYGQNGVTQNYTKAVEWYQEASVQGHAIAQHSLGVCYEDGKGLKRNYSEAIKWYQKAAEQGDERARNNLRWLQSRFVGVFDVGRLWYTPKAEAASEGRERKEKR